jgi:hypothetical protein
MTDAIHIAVVANCIQLWINPQDTRVCEHMIEAALAEVGKPPRGQGKRAAFPDSRIGSLDEGRTSSLLGFRKLHGTCRQIFRIAQNSSQAKSIPESFQFRSLLKRQLLLVININ